MTSRERLEAALRGESTDCVPFSPFPAYVWEYFPQDVQDAGHLAFHHRIGSDPLWRGAPCPVAAVPPPEVETKTVDRPDRVLTEIVTPVGRLTQTHMKSEAGNTSFLVEHPLKTEEDYKIQTWIEEHTELRRDPEPVAAHFAGDGREGLSLGMLVPRMKSAYQTLVEHLAGTEELIYAQMDFPETVRTLWETMVARDLDAVRLATESEYDYFITWEDSSTQNYSPAQYDEFIGSEIGQWCEILGASGKSYVQRACGHVAALVERMRDHGALAIESISPPPTGNIEIRDARKAAGPDFGIIGGIEPTIFLNLSEAQLADHVESIIDDARGGPFILANSDSCPPGVTVEKFQLVADIARQTPG